MTGDCGWCAEPLGGDPDRACAGCGAGYHRACADQAGRCAHASCPQARPSHPAWTVQARARDWLLLRAPPPARWLRVLMLLAALPLAGRPDGKELVEAGRELIGAGVLDRWLLVSALVSLTLTPWVAMLVLAWVESAAHRDVLIDAHGLLLDHSPAWHGARLDWRRIAAYRITAGGVRIVVRGRPWTRLLGPTIPCEGRLQHDVVEVLARRGVARLDA